MEAIYNFFSGFNIQKAMLLVLSPFLAMWNDYRVMGLGLLLVMTLDLVTGIKVFCKVNGVKIRLFKPSSWGHIQSGGLRRTLAKAKDYIGLIMAVFFFENYMLKMVVDIFNHNLVELVIVILGSVELWSIGENFKKSRGYNIIDYIRKIVLEKDFKWVANDVMENNKKDVQK